MKNRIFALALCLALCLGLCACGGAGGAVPSGASGQDGSESAPAESTPASEPAESKTSYAVGETAELAGVEVTLTQVEESHGKEFFEPDAGKVFLLCHFDIANNSEEDLSVSSLLSFEAYVDDYAANQSLTATMSSGEPQLDGAVSAGKKLAGVIGYQVDPDWSALEITFTPDVWSGESATFTAERQG